MCEPNLEEIPGYTDESSVFYQNPEEWLMINDVKRDYPDYVIMFDVLTEVCIIILTLNFKDPLPSFCPSPSFPYPSPPLKPLKTHFKVGNNDHVFLFVTDELFIYCNASYYNNFFYLHSDSPPPICYWENIFV